MEIHFSSPTHLVISTPSFGRVSDNTNEIAGCQTYWHSCRLKAVVKSTLIYKIGISFGGNIELFLA